MKRRILIDLVDEKSSSISTVKTETFVVHMGFAKLPLRGRYKNGARHGKWCCSAVSSRIKATYRFDWEANIATIKLDPTHDKSEECLLTGEFYLCDNNHIRFGGNWNCSGGTQDVRIGWNPIAPECIWEVSLNGLEIRSRKTNFHQDVAAYSVLHKASGTTSFGGTRFSCGLRTPGGMMTVNGKTIFGQYIRVSNDAKKRFDLENDILRANDGRCYDRSGKRVRLIAQEV